MQAPQPPAELSMGEPGHQHGGPEAIQHPHAHAQPPPPPPPRPSLDAGTCRNSGELAALPGGGRATQQQQQSYSRASSAKNPFSSTPRHLRNEQLKRNLSGVASAMMSEPRMAAHLAQHQQQAPPTQPPPPPRGSLDATSPGGLCGGGAGSMPGPAAPAAWGGMRGAVPPPPAQPAATAIMRLAEAASPPPAVVASAAAAAAVLRRPTPLTGDGLHAGAHHPGAAYQHLGGRAPLQPYRQDSASSWTLEGYGAGGDAATSSSYSSSAAGGYAGQWSEASSHSLLPSSGRPSMSSTRGSFDMRRSFDSRPSIEQQAQAAARTSSEWMQLQHLQLSPAAAVAGAPPPLASSWLSPPPQQQQHSALGAAGAWGSYCGGGAGTSADSAPLLHYTDPLPIAGIDQASLAQYLAAQMHLWNSQPLPDTAAAEAAAAAAAAALSRQSSSDLVRCTGSDGFRQQQQPGIGRQGSSGPLPPGSYQQVAGGVGAAAARPVAPAPAASGDGSSSMQLPLSELLRQHATLQALQADLAHELQAELLHLLPDNNN